MRNTTLNVAISVMAFIAGIVTALAWQSGPPKRTPDPPTVNVQTPSPTPTPTPAVPQHEPIHEAVFANGRLRVMPEEIKLKSTRLKYEIDVSYPQILGSDEPYIRRLNQRFKQLATEDYQWQLHPTKKDLRQWENAPAPSNSMDLDYDVVLANDSLLSVSFTGYSYGIGAAHAVEFSFTVNYDLAARKELELSDIFKPRSKYLEFLAEYCKADLAKSISPIFDGSPEAKAESFKSWYFTDDGIAINFDACSVSGCSEGAAVVNISCEALQSWLRPRFRH